MGSGSFKAGDVVIAQQQIFEETPEGRVVVLCEKGEELIVRKVKRHLLRVSKRDMSRAFNVEFHEVSPQEQAEELMPSVDLGDAGLGLLKVIMENPDKDFHFRFVPNMVAFEVTVRNRERDLTCRQFIGLLGVVTHPASFVATIACEICGTVERMPGENRCRQKYEA